MPVFPFITLAALIGLLVSERLGSAGGRWVFKPLASAGFIATALEVGAADHVYGRVVLAALVLSMLGDVLLIPRRTAFFMAGIAAFLLAHVAFAAAFVVRGVEPLVVLGAAVVLFVPSWIVLRWLRPFLPQRFLVPVSVYVLAVTSMMVLALATVAASNGPWLIGAGAGLFYASDFFVARNRFVKPGLTNRLAGLPLYYAGQILLALSASSCVR
jgi:uncharacterized membrane protein YhhN